jgi:O-antigen/teichoic acid export membrane protein
MDAIAVTRRWEMLFALAQIATAVVVLLAGGGLLTLVAAQQLWLIAGAVRNRWLLKHLYPNIMANKAHRSPQVLSGLWPAAWRSGVGVLLSQGIIQASGLIYGQMATATQLASYMLALRLITTVSQFSQAPFYSKLPQMAQCYAQGQTAEQLVLAKRGMRLAHWVFVAGCLAVGWLADPLLALVGSKTPFVSREMWWLIGAAFFAERLGAMYLQLYSTTNHIVWHIANGVTGALMLALGVGLYPYLGITAFPLAMLVAYCGFYTWYAIRLSSKAFDFKWLAFERQCALLPIGAAVTGAGIYQLIATRH